MPESAAVSLPRTVGPLRGARTAALVLAAIVIVLGVYLALGPPRVLWLNTGLRIEYEWKSSAAALLAAAGAAGLAWGVRRTIARALLAGFAVLFVAFGIHRLAYRVEAVDDGLRSRGLLGTTLLPWASISRVDMGRDGLALVSDRGATRVDTGQLTADQRAAFERTVARRVREANERTDVRPAGEKELPEPQPSPETSPAN